MALVKFGAADSLPRGAMRELRHGEEEIVVCNVDGTIHALENRCPHSRGPLAQGALHGKMIVCPWHAWEFDATTGECDFNPAVCLRRFNVHLEAGQVFIEV
ncbi:MAG: Rieske (2Fe-2S) protein [Acidobacteria bacterium]|nr:Rieske (2Fe-2S) protein [Acidobacteriota bacterium]